MGHITEVLGNKVLELVLPMVATVAAGMVVAVLVRLLKKIGLDVDEAQRDKVKTTVRDAILAVEEQTRKTPLNGETKRTLAADIVRRQIPDVTEAQLAVQIHAQLPELRASLGPPVPSTPGTFGRPKTAEEIARATARNPEKVARP